MSKQQSGKTIGHGYSRGLPKWLSARISVLLLVLSSLGASLAILAFPSTANAQAEQSVRAIPNEASAIRAELQNKSLRWRLQGLELPNGRQAEPELQEIEVFAPDAAVVTAKNGRLIRSPREKLRVLRGSDPSNPDSTTILVIREDGRIQGKWRSGSESYHLAMGSTDTSITASLAEEPTPSGNPFENDQIYPEAPPQQSPTIVTSGLTAFESTTSALAPGELYAVTVAVDTDYEMVQALGSQSDVVVYLASLFAYVNVTYESEINTRLLIGDVIMPNSSVDDTYNAWTGCDDRLIEVQNKYTANTAISRALLAHFSPSGGNCGIAYTPLPAAGSENYGGVLCSANSGYAVMNVDGVAPASTTPIASSWDAIVTAHELGHNFNSPHSHCYGNLNGGTGNTFSTDPVDSCFVQEVAEPTAENSCASGTAQLPGPSSLSGGTPGNGDGVLMSYCHLLSPGQSNMSRTFGAGHTSGIFPERVAERMSLAVANAYNYSNSCIGTTTATPPTPPPDSPSISSVTTEQTSATTSDVAVAFTPATTGESASSYTATCVPVANPRVTATTNSSEAMTATTNITSNIPSGSKQALLQLHHSKQFRDDGLRCATDKVPTTHSDSRLQRADLTAAITSDCSNSATVIRPVYEPTTNTEYVVPVYFHVIHKTDNATGNVSIDRINQQMAVLNEDFAGFLGAGTDTSVRFVLQEALYYPNDAWFNDVGAGGGTSLFKAQIAKDPTRFLNVYTNDAGGGNVLGYATLPAGSAGSSQDGVVMLHSTIGGRNNGFGAFDQGRTLVHEVGHYLGLLHTFEPGGLCTNSYNSGDLLEDTPPQPEPDYTSGSSQCGVPSAFENFMNYSDDVYMYTFSLEQRNRMLCSLQNYRASAFESVPTGSVTVADTGTTSPILLSGLTNGTSYSCSVSANGTGGTSDSSSSIVIVAGDSDADGTFNWDDAFPNDPTETQDSDGDGLGDNLEATLGTSPNLDDTDGDGYTDFEEYQAGTDATSASDYPISQGLPVWLLYEATQ